MQEPGNASHLTNATLASEHPGTNVSEPLITTGDTLGNYQTISEKVYLLSAFHVVWI